MSSKWTSQERIESRSILAVNCLASTMHLTCADDCYLSNTLAVSRSLFAGVRATG